MAAKNVNMGGQDTAEKKEESKASPAAATSGGKSSNAEISSALRGDHGPAIRVVVSGKPDAEVWLQGVPTPLLRAVENLTKSPSIWTHILKNIFPVLTSVATVGIAVATLVYTNNQKNADQDAAQKKALTDLLNDFGNTTVPSDPNSAEELKLGIAAMRLAAYGEQALPAVRMAFGASDSGLQYGGLLVAEQIYRANTMEHSKLIQEIFDFYRGRSPTLQQSVLKWLVRMKNELSNEEGRLAIDMLRQSFGAKGENCPNQNVGVAMEATNVLPIWPSGDSKELLGGMSVNCKDKEVRDHASLLLNSLKP